MKIIVAGGSGFVGKALLAKLMGQGHSIVVLSRSQQRSLDNHANLQVVIWDAKTQGPWSKEIDGADAIINLTGESVASKRWTPEQKERIVASRLESTRAIVDAIRSAQKRPECLVNASAAGFYGDVPESDVDESAAKGQGFLSDTCERWEQEALKATELGVRVVILRIGVVLAKGGGALEKMIFPFKFFAGGPLGSGRQWFPWVHRDDLVEAAIFAATNRSLKGPINVAAPESVRMVDFCRELGKAMNRPSWAPVPDFALKFLLGEMSTMLLEGQKMKPRRLEETGFKFLYPELQPALESLEP